jgi:copper chaperone CopZ
MSETTTYSVHDMRGGHCEPAITRALQAVAGHELIYADCRFSRAR